MKQLNLYYLGGGGGGSVPDGRTVTPINDVTIWQQCAGISNPTYTTLAEILADTGILQTLMASNNAVDYLARSKAFIEKIPLVPQMTGYTSPSGEVDCSGVDSSNPTYYGWKAFDRDESTVWWSNSASNAWVQFTFDVPTKVNKISVKSINDGVIRLRNFKIQGSNDKFVSDTHDLYSGVYANSATLQDFDFSNDTPYETYRLLALDNYGSGNLVVAELQFYYGDGICQSSDAMYYVGQNNYCSDTLLADATWRNAIQNSAYFKSVYNDHNPIMTSNTTPSGVASSQSGFLENPWKAMDGDDVTTPRTTSSPFVNVTRGLIYEFATPICIKLIESLLYTEAGGGYGAATNKIYYEISDDGINWTDLYVDTEFANRTTKRMIDCSSNTISCKYVAMTLIGNSYSWNFRVNTSNYYGRKNV